MKTNGTLIRFLKRWSITLFYMHYLHTLNTIKLLFYTTYRKTEKKVFKHVYKNQLS